MKYSVIAPHIDDEFIGCFTLLKNKKIEKVYYLHAESEERKKEAENCSKIFQFEPIFSKPIIIDDSCKYLIPTRKDMHPDHIIANRQFLKEIKNKEQIVFYSTRMNVEWVQRLSDEDRKRKKKLFLELFPSQKNFLQSFPFVCDYEGIRNCFNLGVSIKFQIEGNHCYPDSKYEFLRAQHPHSFTVIIDLCEDGSRELEFIELRKRIIQSFSQFPNFNTKSCEEIAIEIFNKFPDLKIEKVSVFEDNNVGAWVEIE